MPPPDLTLVIEMDTRTITGGGYDARSSLRAWIRQADALGRGRCEILVSSSHPGQVVETLATDRTTVRNTFTTGASYYGLKNAGAEAAHGRIVIFSDSDCHPGDDFLDAVLKAFEDPSVSCVAGRTLYDGTDLFTRINSTTSFGYLHQNAPLAENQCALSHNVAVRRDSYTGTLFGPFNGRIGGDMYMTDAYRQRGPIPIVPGMLIYHENSTFSIRGLLDRQLREIFSVSDQVERDGARPNPSALFRKVMQTALKRPGRQLRLVRRFGRSLGIRPWHAPLVWTMLSLHALLNIVASLAILVSPGLTRRWLHYQFGVAREDSGNALSAEAADRVDA